MAVSAWSLAFGVPPANTQLINRLRAFVALSVARGDSFEAFQAGALRIKQEHLGWINPDAQKGGPTAGGRDDG